MIRQIPGINIRAPWAQLILEGKKTIETRFYPLPAHYVGRDVAIIETPGPEGKFRSRVIGIVVFGECFVYETEESFYQDLPRHCVHPNSDDFTWESGDGKRKWGWPILSVRAAHSELPPRHRRGIVYSKSVPVPFS